MSVQSASRPEPEASYSGHSSEVDVAETDSLEKAGEMAFVSAFFASVKSNPMMFGWPS